jgi:hypothetical protein
VETHNVMTVASLMKLLHLLNHVPKTPWTAYSPCP